MEDDDIFLLSFADALTCVFGAAVALFMIFVVLVKLSPADPGQANEIEEQLSASSSFAQFLQTGSGDLIVHVKSQACSDLEALTMKDASHSWLIEDTTRTGAKRCARVFEVPRKAVARGATLDAANLLASRLEIRLVAGAAFWPLAGPHQYDEPLDCAISGVMARLSDSADEPLILQECPS